MVKILVLRPSSHSVLAGRKSSYAQCYEKGPIKNLSEGLWVQSILLPPFYQYRYSHGHVSQAPVTSCHLDEPPTLLIDYKGSLRRPVS